MYVMKQNIYLLDIPSIFYNMIELGFVELWHWLLGVQSQEGWVTGVDEEAGEVRGVVEAEDEDVDDEERELGGGVDGGDEGEEDVEGEGEQEHPGDHLLGVEGQLQPVHPPPLPELLARAGGWSLARPRHPHTVQPADIWKHES